MASMIEDSFVEGPDLDSDVPVSAVLSGAADCARVALVGVSEDGTIYVAGSDAAGSGTIELLAKGIAWLAGDHDSMEFH